MIAPVVGEIERPWIEGSITAPNELKPEQVTDPEQTDPQVGADTVNEVIGIVTAWPTWQLKEVTD